MPDRVEAATEVERIIGPGLASQLSSEDLEHALNQAVTPDAAGRIPGQDGYEDTYDPHWAAAEAVTTLAIRQAGQGHLTSFTAEGATFATTGPDLWGMAAQIRARSSLGRLLATQHGTLGVLELDADLGYDPTAPTWPTSNRPDLDWS